MAIPPVNAAAAEGIDSAPCGYEPPRPSAIMSSDVDMISPLICYGSSGSHRHVGFSSTSLAKHFRLLRWTIIVFGYWPMISKRSCRRRFSSVLLVMTHRVLVFVCLSMGFYSITGDTEQARATSFLAVSIDFLYPLTYLATLGYINGSSDFKTLCSRAWVEQIECCRRTSLLYHYAGILRWLLRFQRMAKALIVDSAAT